MNAPRIGLVGDIGGLSLISYVLYLFLMYLQILTQWLAPDIIQSLSDFKYII